MAQQPDKDTSYNVQDNPASKEPAEKSNASTGQSGSQVEHRGPSNQTTSSSQATPQASAQGVRGAGPGEKESDLSEADKGRSHVDDADQQMGAPGEGKVADAVKGNSNSGGGGAGRQDGTESELDRKKAEQAPKRAEMKEEGKKEVDVGGVLGQRAAPADPSDS